MAYNSAGLWTPEDDSVASGVAKITSQNSPLMQQAQTQAAQTSNRRGLLNSSMATGEAQRSVLNAAIPIASQDAQQTSQKNIYNQTFQQGLVTQGNELQAKKDATAAQIAQQDRQYAMSAVAKAQENYDAAFMNIAKEYNLPETARNSYLSHLGALRDSDLNLVEQMYGIDLNWGSTGGPTSTGTSITAPSSNPLIKNQTL